VLPHRRTTYGGQAFAVAGPSTWNSLPKCPRDPSSSFAVFAHSSSKSTSVSSALEALVMMRYINLHFTLHLHYIGRHHGIGLTLL